jgi:hypothetical protein
MHALVFIAQQHKSCVHKKGSWSHGDMVIVAHIGFYLLAEEDHYVDLPNGSHTLRGKLFGLRRFHWILKSPTRVK